MEFTDIEDTTDIHTTADMVMEVTGDARRGPPMMSLEMTSAKTPLTLDPTMEDMGMAVDTDGEDMADIMVLDTDGEDIADIMEDTDTGDARRGPLKKRMLPLPKKMSSLHPEMKR
jgi:hypothetical protein